MLLYGVKNILKNLRSILRNRALSLAAWISTHISKIRNIEFYDLIVLLAIFVYGIIFSYFTVLKHNVFQSFAWDLGIFDQALYTTLRGKFLYYTPELYLNLSGCVFAQHISPILLLLLPLYAIRPSATTLLVVKSFVLALGAFPLYLIANKVLKNKKISALLALIYLLYPPLQAANWFDFQPQVFLPLFIFSSYYFMKVRRWKLYFLMTLLALMVQEHIAIIIFVLSAYILVSHWKTLLPALKDRQINEALISIATMMLCIIWFISAIHWKGSFPINQQFIERYKAVGTYSVLGVKKDPLFLPVNVLLNPQRAWDAIMYDYPIKLLYIVLLFGPLAFLPFRSTLSLGIFALLMPFLLSNYWAYYTIGAHYPLYILSFIFLAAVNALKQIHPKAQLPILEIALMATILLIASTSPLSPMSEPFGAAKMRILWYPDVNLSPTEHSESLHDLLRLIPPEASVLTQNHIFPHVSARLHAYVVPPIEPYENDTTYVADLINKSEYVLIDFYGWDYHTEMVFNMVLNNETHGVYALGSNSLLFKKGYQGSPIFAHYTEHRSFPVYKDLQVGSGQIVPDPYSKSGFVALCPEGFMGSGLFGPYTYLLPGEYNITFTIKLGEHDDGYIGTLDVSDNYSRSILSRRDIYGFELQSNEWTNLTLSFTSTKLRTSVEFRYFNSGTTDTYIDRVIVERISSIAKADSGLMTFNARDLSHVSANITYDGFLVHQQNITSNLFWWGPYTSLPPANYKITFFLKTSPLPQWTDDKILTLDISSDCGVNIHAERDVNSSSFLYNDDNNSDWHKFTIHFTIEDCLENVEFRGLNPSPKYNLYLAFILVEKVS